MGGFPAKLVLVLVAVYLLLGLLPETSALLHHGNITSFLLITNWFNFIPFVNITVIFLLLAEDGEKSVWHVDCRHGLMKIHGRKQGSFGCQNGIVKKEIVPTRSLRVMVTSRAPPSPVKNKATSQHVAAVPPSSIA